MSDHPDGHGWWTEHDETPEVLAAARPAKLRGRRAKWDAHVDEVLVARKHRKKEARRLNKDRFVNFMQDTSDALQKCTPLGPELSETVVKLAYCCRILQ